jgi:hypothetical protein
MITNWFDETKKELRKGDRMQKSYRVELNSHEGYLTLTDRRIIFLRVDGFIRKSYNKTLDYSYDEIQEIKRKNSHSFELICTNDKKYSFETLGIPAIHIVTRIKYYKKTILQASFEDQVVTTSQIEEVK